MDAREYVVLTNSASKRALFPSYSVSKSKSDDEDSLGHMSPLMNSSPDRYSSPPHSPCWVEETPSKAPETCKDNFRNEATMNACRNLQSPMSNGSLQKIFTDIINDTPEKDCASDMLTPFKCLVQRRNIEETPDSVVSKSCDATKKLYWKKKSQIVNSPQKNDETKSFDFNSSIAKLIKNSFYRPNHSRAKTSLFSDSVSEKKPHSVTMGFKTRHLNATYPGSHHHNHHRRTNKRPRAMLGEINAGVRHKVKRPKLKVKRSMNKITKSVEMPLISPEDRVQKYIMDNGLLDKENTPVKRPKLSKDVSPSSRTVDDERGTDVSVPMNLGSPITNTNVSSMKKSVKSSPEVELVSDPNKKFFKTNRTMAIDHKATVTVVNNVKIQVHNGKLALNSPARKAKPMKKRLPVLIENIFEDDPSRNVETNAVQETVQEVLQKLDDELETPCQSEDSFHIHSITTSTSSLALHDIETVNMKEPTHDLENCNPEGSLAETGTPDQSSKLYPVFYKRKGLHDATNQKKLTPPPKKMRPLGENQYQIDAGQSHFRAVHCKECGTLYHVGDPEDEMMHYNIHNNISTFKFVGWKNERVIKLCPDGGRVILVYPDDSKVWVNKTKDVLATVDREMGIIDCPAPEIDSNKIYLYVLKHRIVGVLAAEPKSEAYRMLNTGPGVPDCCSEQAYSVKCGVSRIWTAPDQRRKGIATSLVNCLRLSFMFDCILDKQEIAFSVPTYQGKAFATSYMKTAEFMVYYK